MDAITVPARPKVNLFLHVTGRRADGYHELESLTCFAETGDTITAEPAPELSLEITGPFKDGLDSGPDNLVIRAAQALSAYAFDLNKECGGAGIILDKALPVASGIGGGSADAAATLCALRSLWSLDISDECLSDIALSLGADVPVCLASRTRMMRGIGELLGEGPVLPPLWIVLANPLCEIPTACVFQALALDAPGAGISEAGVAVPLGFETADGFCAWLKAFTRNDLEAPARSFAPEISLVLDTLNNTDGCCLARMSGSGATCFALFSGQAAAEKTSALLSGRYPAWWVRAAQVI